MKRAGSEFTEEALTEVAQRISDGFVMGEQSEYSAYMRELMKAGLAELYSTPKLVINSDSVYRDIN